MELIELNELLQTLMDLARDVEERYRQNLASSKRYTTEYTLLDSVRTEVKVADRGYEVTMSLKDYWKYVEYDTKPHFPPVDKILSWIQIKPIFPKPDSLGRKPTENQLAYLIGRKISVKGTTGTHDLRHAKDEIIPQYQERLSKALGHDVQKYLLKLLHEEK